MGELADREMEESIRRFLTADSRVDMTEVDVCVENRTVHLSGTVDSAAERQAVLEDVGAAARVEDIVDQLVLCNYVERTDEELKEVVRHALARDIAVNAELVSVMGLNQQRAKEVAAQFGVPHSCSTEAELLAQNLQAVYIAAPPNVHCRQTMQATQAGKHVWLGGQRNLRPISGQRSGWPLRGFPWSRCRTRGRGPSTYRPASAGRAIE